MCLQRVKKILFPINVFCVMLPGGWKLIKEVISLKSLSGFYPSGRSFLSFLTIFLLSFLHRRVTCCALLKPTVDSRSLQFSALNCVSLSAFACLNRQHKQFFYCLCELKFVWVRVRGRVKVRGQGSGGVRITVRLGGRKIWVSREPNNVKTLKTWQTAGGSPLSSVVEQN